MSQEGDRPKRIARKSKTRKIDSDDEDSPVQQRQETEQQDFVSEDPKDEPDLYDMKNASITELEAKMRELERKLNENSKGNRKRDTKKKDKHQKEVLGDDGPELSSHVPSLPAQKAVGG